MGKSQDEQVDEFDTFVKYLFLLIVNKNLLFESDGLPEPMTTLRSKDPRDLASDCLPGLRLADSLPVSLIALPCNLPSQAVL